MMTLRMVTRETVLVQKAQRETSSATKASLFLAHLSLSPTVTKPQSGYTMLLTYSSVTDQTITIAGSVDLVKKRNDLR